MILSDRDLADELGAGTIRVEPLGEEAIRPASVDVRLDNQFAIREGNGFGEIPLYSKVVVKEGRTLTIKPGQFLLGQTLECVKVPDYVRAQVSGKSTLGRQGLMVHVTAGLIDPGFEGRITLELKNVSEFPIELTPGQYIAQIEFAYLNSKCIRPYNDPSLKSHYFGQMHPMPTHSDKL